MTRRQAPCRDQREGDISVLKLALHPPFYYLSSIFIVIIFLFPQISSAVEPIFLIDGNIVLLPEKQIQYYKDQTNALTIEEIEREKETGQFKKVDAGHISLGYSTSTYWFTFDVFNPHQKEKTVFFEIAKAYHDQLTLYHPLPGNGYYKRVTGDHFSFGSRDVPHRFPTFELIIAPQSTQTYYLKVKSNDAMVFPLRLYYPDGYAEKVFKEGLILGLNYGIMAVMIFYSLIIYLVVRDSTYLYYAAYIVMFTLFQLSVNGISFQFFWPDSPWMANNAMAIQGMFYPFCAGLFCRKFLDTRHYSPGFDRLILLMLGVLFILAAISFGLDHRTSVKLMMITGMTWPVIYLAAGFWCWIKGNATVRFYILGWSLFLSGVLILIFRTYGLIPPCFLSDYAMQIGSSLEAVLLSFALGDRINQLKKEREEALEVSAKSRQEALMAQKRLAEGLERDVAARTAELKKTNDKLVQMSITDGLTQLFNRRHFDEVLNREWHRLQRDQLPLSLIMCDIDHFKQFNDTYGHPAGDQCIHQVASVIRSKASRAHDLPVRYGGEEFAVLLPQTEKEGAIEVAEAIIKEIEGLAIPHETSSVASVVTLSAGVTTIVPSSGVSPESIIKQADELLYASKQRGRNRLTSSR